MVLTKEEFLQEGALKTEVVTLEKGDVIVSQVGGADYIKLWSDPKNQKATGVKLLVNGVETDEMVIDMSRFTPALMTYAIVNGDGTRMFADEDIELVARLASGPFLKVSQAARKLNGLTGEEAKNSEATLTEETSGESQLPLDIDTLIS
jgi:hypothetical protein